MAGDTTGSVMRAGDVGRAARRDLQFRIPRKPVVRLGLRARPEETGWIIDGARKSQVLGGAFAREHMGALLQACDGTRTLEEIGEVTGVGPQAAFEAVSLLWTGGIVEEGDTEPAPGDPAPELARLLSRLGDSTGVNDSWQDAARRLAAARVAVVGDAELAGEMVAALEPTLPEVRLDSAPRRGDTLTVLVETADSAARSQEVARRCREEGIALLRVRAEQEAVTVGPYVDESFSPCLACACADEPEIGPRPEPARHDIIVGLAARAVAALLARATVTHLRTPDLARELVSAAEALATASIRATVPAPHHATRIPDDTSRVFAWALKEAVTNVIRHSGATHCVVELAPSRLVVRDDGRGFRSTHRGNGLGGLEARVAESGGTLTITSDSSGTELNITMDTP